MDLLTVACLGALIGLATGLVPGLHVNTLAAVAFAARPSPTATLMLVAAGIVHTIVNIVPSTYLGAPDEDDVLVVLPAHRMMLDGDGRQAVHSSAMASLSAVLLCAAAAPLYALALHTGLYRWSTGHAVPVLVAVLVLLLAQEMRRGVDRAGWAVATMAASGVFGILAARAPVGGASGHLLPMLAGLFGLAGMLAALRRPPKVPRQLAPDQRGVPVAPLLGGTFAASATALLPGLTSSVAAACLPRSTSPRRAVAALSVINTAHAVFAIQVALALGRVRTGLAEAVTQGRPLAVWSPVGPGTDALRVIITIVAAGLVGAAGTLALDAVVAKQVHRLPGRALSLTGIACVVGLTAWLTGLAGLAVLAIGAVIGAVPLAAGIRRVHLVACLIVPALVRLWP